MRRPGHLRSWVAERAARNERRSDGKTAARPRTRGKEATGKDGGSPREGVDARAGVGGSERALDMLAELPGDDTINGKAGGAAGELEEADLLESPLGIERSRLVQGDPERAQRKGGRE
jgi:hypothetical protein